MPQDLINVPDNELKAAVAAGLLDDPAIVQRLDSDSRRRLVLVRSQGQPVPAEPAGDVLPDIRRPGPAAGRGTQFNPERPQRAVEFAVTPLARPTGIDAIDSFTSPVGMASIAAGGAGIVRAGLAGGAGAALRASGPAILAQVAPVVKYEIAKTALQSLGIRPEIAMAVALAVSGYKRGAKGGSPTPAAEPVADVSRGAAPVAEAVAAESPLALTKRLKAERMASAPTASEPPPAPRAAGEGLPTTFAPIRIAPQESGPAYGGAGEILLPTRKVDPFIVHHEDGHFVWHERSSPTDRAAWEKAYKALPEEHQQALLGSGGIPGGGHPDSLNVSSLSDEAFANLIAAIQTNHGEFLYYVPDNMLAMGKAAIARATAARGLQPVSNRLPVQSAAAEPPVTAPAAPPATPAAGAKLKLTSEEFIEFTSLLRRGVSPEKAMAQIQLARQLRQSGSFSELKSPTRAETRFPKGQRGNTHPEEE